MQDYFGVCPKTGTCDGYVNIGSAHWFYSTKGETKLYFGNNVFSSRHDEDGSVWDENRAMLSGFTEVEPLLAAA